ncbi:MAG: N-acetylmuramoyl-L-alanine amidase [Rickettsiales bacterium]
MKLKSYFMLPLLLVSMGWAELAYGWGIEEIRLSRPQESITLRVPDTSDYKVFTLSNPPRLVVDVPLLSQRPDLSLPQGYTGRLIRNVRFARFDKDTSRFVFDLNMSVEVIDVSERSDTLLSVQIAAGKGTRVVKKEPKKPKKPVVVIDAGHGGQDPGASGKRGTREKHVVLLYAKALKAKLLKTGRYQVVLTREKDHYIRLRERVEIARKAKGDIFISLHADSAPNRKTRGLSVYTVSEKASDAEAEALAARENKSDVIAGMDLSTEREDVAGILISLAQRETKNNSSTLADLLVVKLMEHVKLLKNTHRFAGFAVLKAPDIPSVLVEIGFLSNPEDEKLLRSKSHREKVTSGIVAGIDAYFEQYKANEDE